MDFSLQFYNSFIFINRFIVAGITEELEAVPETLYVRQDHTLDEITGQY